MLTTEEVSHIAQLARLKLTNEEIELYRNQLSTILDYVNQLQEVDTTGIEPTSQVTGLHDVTREDEVRPTNVDVHQRILNQFPLKENGYLKVRGVFDA